MSGMKACIIGTLTTDSRSIWEIWRRQGTARKKGQEEHLGFSNGRKGHFPGHQCERSQQLLKHHGLSISLYPQPVSSLPHPQSCSFPNLLTFLSSSVSNRGRNTFGKGFPQAWHMVCGPFPSGISLVTLESACHYKSCSELVQYSHSQVLSPPIDAWVVNVYFTDSNSALRYSLKDDEMGK